MTDYEAAYRELRERVTELLADRTDAELEQVAPATPAWRVRDVVAHMAGVCDDIMNGNMAGVATDAWTQAQVDKRAGWQPVADPRRLGGARSRGRAADERPSVNRSARWWSTLDPRAGHARRARRRRAARDCSAMDDLVEWFVETNQAVAPTEPGGADC